MHNPPIGLRVETTVPFSAIQESSKQTIPERQLTHSEIGTSFGERANHYEDGRPPNSDETFAIARKYVLKQEPVLDIGCGTGLSTVPLIKLFENVRGCDKDKRMLEKAEQKAPGHFDFADVYKLPYKDGAFGLVTAFNAYHWFCDDDATKQISRVLKPGGFFLICKNGNGGEGALSKANRIIKETLVNTEISEPGTNYKPDEVLTRNGFKIEEKITLDETETYTVDQALHRKQADSIWKYVTEAKQEKNMVEKLRTHFETLKDEKGFVYENRKRIVMLAKKCNLTK